jgi:hypothetical protein
MAHSVSVLPVERLGWQHAAVDLLARYLDAALAHRLPPPGGPSPRTAAASSPTATPSRAGWAGRARRRSAVPTRGAARAAVRARGPARSGLAMALAQLREAVARATDGRSALRAGLAAHYLLQAPPPPGGWNHPDGSS